MQMVLRSVFILKVYLPTMISYKNWFHNFFKSYLAFIMNLRKTQINAFPHFLKKLFVICHIFYLLSVQRNINFLFSVASNFTITKSFLNKWSNVFCWVATGKMFCKPSASEISSWSESSIVTVSLSDDSWCSLY